MYRVTHQILNTPDAEGLIAELNAIGLIFVIKDFCEQYSLRAIIYLGGHFTEFAIDGYMFRLLQSEPPRFTLSHNNVTFNCKDAQHALQIFKAIIL